MAEQKEIPTSLHPVEPHVDAAFRFIAFALKSYCDHHREVRTVEIIAVLTRQAGYAIGMCEPEYKDALVELAHKNIELGHDYFMKVLTEQAGGTKQ